MAATSKYVRYNGEKNVYDTGSGKIVTYEQAQAGNLFAPGVIKDVSGKNPFAGAITAGSFAGKNLTAYEKAQITPDAATNTAGATDITPFQNATSSGIEASFGANVDAATKGLQELNAKNTDRIEAQRKAGMQGIETSNAILKEEIQQKNLEGNRQISYAQERLGGSVILRRNIEDFTANVNKFHSDVNRSLERLEIEKNTALAANDNNAYNALNALTEKMYSQQLSMYDRQLDVYFKSAQLAIQQHESANKDLEVMLQYAALDNLSLQELQSVADKTGFSVSTLQALGAQSQRDSNAKLSGKGKKSYPSALIPWQGMIDKAILGTADIEGATVDEALRAVFAEVKALSIDLSEADRAALSDYAVEQFEAKRNADKSFQDSETQVGGTGEGNIVDQARAGNAASKPLAELLANSFFGQFSADDKGNITNKKEDRSGLPEFLR